MTESEYLLKLHEADRLLNDPATSLDAARIWSLLADIARYAEPWAATPGSSDSGSATDGGGGTHAISVRWLSGRDA
jgi:hypothetical protein